MYLAKPIFNPLKHVLPKRSDSLKNLAAIREPFMKSVQIRTRNNCVFGHFSLSEVYTLEG